MTHRHSIISQSHFNVITKSNQNGLLWVFKSMKENVAKKVSLKVRNEGNLKRTEKKRVRYVIVKGFKSNYLCLL